jgi:hypothetical protein
VKLVEQFELAKIQYMQLKNYFAEDDKVLIEPDPEG